MQASAVATNDNLEFLEDVVPRTHTYKSVKQRAQETRARINGEPGVEEKKPRSNGKKQQKLTANGAADRSGTADEHSEDPNAQLELEASQAAGEDVPMRD